MAAATLSGDQRHLLSLLNPESLLDALLSTQGADRVMSRSGGGCGFAAPEGAPAWMTNYDTVHRQIVSPTAWHGPPQVAVSAAQIVRFGAGLPEPVREQMRACLRDAAAERLRALDWCYCPYADRPRNAHAGPCSRHHPTDAEAAAHRAALRALAHRAATLVADILAVGDGQLPLFT
ncbi:MAG: hypothetical protein QG655_1222 [Actinomycetota bacterium]|jgi:hypothetical protein|nr:hypothetical protein [Actinomycetota bacterium]